jgi:hypothetical protein
MCLKRCGWEEGQIRTCLATSRGWWLAFEPWSSQSLPGLVDRAVLKLALDRVTSPSPFLSKQDNWWGEECMGREGHWASAMPGIAWRDPLHRRSIVFGSSDCSGSSLSSLHPHPCFQTLLRVYRSSFWFGGRGVVLQVGSWTHLTLSFIPYWKRTEFPKAFLALG